MTEIGNRIASERRRLGLTQAELAEKLGIVSQTVSNWEVGRGSPRASAMQQLREMGFDLNLIFGDRPIDELHENV